MQNWVGDQKVSVVRISFELLSLPHGVCWCLWCLTGESHLLSAQIPTSAREGRAALAGMSGNQICRFHLVPFVRSGTENKSMGLEH